LLLVRGTMGLCTTPLHPGAARSVGLWVDPNRRTLANGLVNGAALLGIASCYSVFGNLIRGLTWPGAFILMGAVTIGVGLIWRKHSSTLFPRGAASEKPASDLASAAQRLHWQSLFRNRGLLLLTVSYGAVGYFQYLFFYWMHFYFDKVLHLGATRSEYYAGIPPLVMAVGMPLGGWAGDFARRRCGRFWVIVPIAGMVGSAVLLAIGIFATSPGWIVAWFSLALGTLGMSEGSFWVTAVELGGKEGGTSAAICNTGGNAGGMLAPIITPWVSGIWGWPVGIGVGSVVCLLGAACWLGIRSGPARAAEA